VTTCTSTSLLARAWAAVPGWTDLGAAIDKVRHRRRTNTTPNPDALRRELLIDLTEQVAQGAALPDDLGRRLWEADHASEIVRAEDHFLRMLEENLKAERDQVERRGVDAALAVLRTELEQLLDEARAVDRALGHVTGADQAVAAGGRAPKAWHRLTQLVASHNELRVAQHAVVRVGFDGDIGRAKGFVDRVGALRNIADLDPPRRPEEAHLPPAWPENDPPAYLRWLAGPEAQPWVPSMAELVEANAELTRRVEQQRYDLAAAAGKVPAAGRVAAEHAQRAALLADRRAARDYDHRIHAAGATIDVP